MNIRKALLGIAVLTVCAFTGARAQDADEVLTNADIVLLTDAGLQPEALVTVIETKSTDFDVSVAQLAQLSRTGVDSSVIQAMVRATANAELVDLMMGAMEELLSATDEDGVPEEERERQPPPERQRQATEADLPQAARDSELAAVDEVRRREEAAALDEYIRLIVNRIRQNWIPPASARAGIQCTVHVTQIPSGDVVDVRVGQCNGDEAVVRSIEAAVLRSSPLPRPRISSLFNRNLEVIFRPEV